MRINTLLGNASVISLLWTGLGGVAAGIASAPDNCLPPPMDLVAWWSAEGDVRDNAGTNHGVLVNGATFAPGKVGQSFAFNGVTQYARIPNSSALNPPNQMSLEAWVCITGFPGVDGVVIAGKDNPFGTNRQYILGLANVSGRWVFRPHLCIPGSLKTFNGTLALQTNTWYHVGMTYDGAALKLYVDGVPDGSLSFTGPINRSANPLLIGGYSSGPWFFNGRVDELSIYSRALSAAEMAAIFNAGAMGKCREQSPPAIVSQPSHQTVPVGTNVEFRVVASGSPPLAYQWSWNSNAIAGATNSSYSLTNVLPADAGLYAVLVSNQFGVTPSSNAALTVEVHPPVITGQPKDLTVVVGADAALTVVAEGSPPLSYEWTLNGSPVPGATNATLSVQAVTAEDAGIYVVQVSSPYGSMPSSNAVLTVNLTPVCAPPPTGITGWWSAEGWMQDTAGTNHGTLVNGATFAPGKVGQAFAFNGINQYARIPDSPTLNSTNQMSLEAWVHITAFPGVDGVSIAGKDNPYGEDRQYLLGMGNDAGRWVFRPHVCIPGSLKYFNGATALRVSTWYHVGMTYDGAALKLYVNGVLDGSLGFTGPIKVTANPLLIGGYSSGPWYFNGRVDELSVYGRALSAAEITAIYDAGSAGKCATPYPPTIVSQPSSQTVQAGANVEFGVIASGSPPLAYQWYRNGNAISGATNPAYALLNVQFANAGRYSVSVTNEFGTALSSNAVLTVVPPPAPVQLGNVSNAVPGGLVVVPVSIVASGLENAIGFSVQFPPSLLSYVDVAAGEGAPGASLIPNLAQTGSGKLGIALSLPPDAHLAPGTQVVALVSFNAAVVTNATVAAVTFGDAPIVRQLSDAAGTVLPAFYVAGSVALPAADIEGDISPRPEGNKAVTISDWVVLGRYAARLDQPANAAEFQRADCAPRSKLGNGSITVTDWVQAGRYAAAVDPLTAAGGPTGESPGAGAAPKHLGSSKTKAIFPSTRRICVKNTLLWQGQSGTVSIELESNGDETGLGFSLSFDPDVLEFVTASLGEGAAGATLNVNTLQAAAGELGFVLAFGTGRTFAPSTNAVVKVNFRALAVSEAGAMLTLTDQPVPREISDATALTLTGDYVNGSVLVNPLPQLEITRATDAIRLAWPAWATNFTLQSVEGTLSPAGSWSNVTESVTVIDSQHRVTLPLGGGLKWYRLIKQ